MSITETMPLPVDLGSSPPPGINAYFLPGGPLVVGIYPTARRGTVYRWDDGLDAPPRVIYWDLDGPECDAERG